MTLREVADSHRLEVWERRLRAAANAYAAAKDVSDDAKETLDHLMIAADDDGISRGKVGRWSGVSPTRVTQIIAERMAS
jgi:hypothetical protein